MRKLNRLAIGLNVLVEAAKQHRLVPYSEFADRLGLSPRGPFSDVLGSIGVFCRSKKTPELWALVVKVNTQLPNPDAWNEGWDAARVRQEQENCFNHNWG